MKAVLLKYLLHSCIKMKINYCCCVWEIILHNPWNHSYGHLHVAACSLGPRLSLEGNIYTALHNHPSLYLEGHIYLLPAEIL